MPALPQDIRWSSPTSTTTTMAHPLRLAVVSVAVACRVIRRGCPRPVRRRRNHRQPSRHLLGNPPVALSQDKLKTLFPRILDSVILAENLLVGTIEARIEMVIKMKIKEKK